MRHISSFLLFAITAFASCDDDTSSVGISTIPDVDHVITSTGIYPINSRSIQVDSVLANTNDCYLGSIIDPETRAKTTCDFLAQFGVLEDTKFPAFNRIVKDESGKPVADSCDIRIYFDEYYGDSLASMKLHVQELDTTRVMEEGTKFYTNFSATDYLNTRPDALTKQVTYAVKDLSRPENETDGTTYYRSIVVKLPTEYGTKLLRKYYENPKFYSNPYQFIHHVCPGFYFKTVGGIGSMVNTEMMGMNLYFRYHTKTEAGNDTIVDGMQRMGGTAEVMQNTRIDNRIPEWMMDDTKGYTYIKSPAGICTELTLPVSDIVAGDHAIDSINQAKILIGAYNAETEGTYALKAPNSVVLLRKKEMFDFFEKEELPDSKESYLASYNSTTQAYEFSNLAYLISSMRIERDREAGIQTTDSEAQRQAKYTEWEAKPENADWNKVVIVPVKAEYRTTSQQQQVLVRVRNSLSLSSVKLRGGNAGALQMEVIYSRYNRK